jgi:hypothetical protein
VYLYLDLDQDAVHPQAQDEGSRELVEELRDQVGYLREQLRREQDAHAEARRIIAALTQRIPELEAPREPREGDLSASGPPDRGEARPSDAGAREGAQRVPWWRRIFGEGE